MDDTESDGDCNNEEGPISDIDNSDTGTEEEEGDVFDVSISAVGKKRAATLPASNNDSKRGSGQTAKIPKRITKMRASMYNLSELRKHLKGRYARIAAQYPTIPYVGECTLYRKSSDQNDRYTICMLDGCEDNVPIRDDDRMNNHYSEIHESITGLKMNKFKYQAYHQTPGYDGEIVQKEKVIKKVIDHKFVHSEKYQAEVMARVKQILFENKYDDGILELCQCMQKFGTTARCQVTYFRRNRLQRVCPTHDVEDFEGIMQDQDCTKVTAAGVIATAAIVQGTIFSKLNLEKAKSTTRAVYPRIFENVQYWVPQQYKKGESVGMYIRLSGPGEQPNCAVTVQNGDDEKVIISTIDISADSAIVLECQFCTRDISTIRVQNQQKDETGVSDVIAHHCFAAKRTQFFDLNYRVKALATESVLIQEPKAMGKKPVQDAKMEDSAEISTKTSSPKLPAETYLSQGNPSVGKTVSTPSPVISLTDSAMANLQEMADGFDFVPPTSVSTKVKKLIPPPVSSPKTKNVTVPRAKVKNTILPTSSALDAAVIKKNSNLVMLDTSTSSDESPPPSTKIPPTLHILGEGSMIRMGNYGKMQNCVHKATVSDLDSDVLSVVSQVDYPVIFSYMTESSCIKKAKLKYRVYRRLKRKQPALENDMFLFTLKHMELVAHYRIYNAISNEGERGGGTSKFYKWDEDRLRIVGSDTFVPFENPAMHFWVKPFPNLFSQSENFLNLDMLRIHNEYRDEETFQSDNASDCHSMDMHHKYVNALLTSTELKSQCNEDFHAYMQLLTDDTTPFTPFMLPVLCTYLQIAFDVQDDYKPIRYENFEGEGNPVIEGHTRRYLSYFALAMESQYDQHVRDLRSAEPLFYTVTKHTISQKKKYIGDVLKSEFYDKAATCVSADFSRRIRIYCDKYHNKYDPGTIMHRRYQSIIYLKAWEEAMTFVMRNNYFCILDLDVSNKNGTIFEEYNQPNLFLFNDDSLTEALVKVEIEDCFDVRAYNNAIVYELMTMRSDNFLAMSDYHPVMHSAVGNSFLYSVMQFKCQYDMTKTVLERVYHHLIEMVGVLNLYENARTDGVRAIDYVNLVFSTHPRLKKRIISLCPILERAEMAATQSLNEHAILRALLHHARRAAMHEAPWLNHYFAMFFGKRIIVYTRKMHHYVIETIYDFRGFRTHQFLPVLGPATDTIMLFREYDVYYLLSKNSSALLDGLGVFDAVHFDSAVQPFLYMVHDREDDKDNVHWDAFRFNVTQPCSPHLLMPLTHILFDFVPRLTLFLSPDFVCVANPSLMNKYNSGNKQPLFQCLAAARECKQSVPSPDYVSSTFSHFRRVIRMIAFGGFPSNFDIAYDVVSSTLYNAFYQLPLVFREAIFDGLSHTMIARLLDYERALYSNSGDKHARAVIPLALLELLEKGPMERYTGPVAYIFSQLFACIFGFGSIMYCNTKIGTDDIEPALYSFGLVDGTTVVPRMYDFRVHGAPEERRYIYLRHDSKAYTWYCHSLVQSDRKGQIQPVLDCESPVPISFHFNTYGT
jgi:hypothetical protein